MATTSAAGSWDIAARPEVGAACERIDALYRQHRSTVSAICRALLGDRAEAEDAAQQVFLSAQNALLNGAVPRDPVSWLAAIARHECWARRRPHTPTPVGIAVDLPDGAAADPPAEVIQRAELAALWQAIAQLPAAQRDALLLREIRGLSYEQLAEELARSGPSVRSLLNRARRRLRSCLEDLHGALAGTSSLDALGRLLGEYGAAAPAAPAATKAVALGLGAAVLAGGVIAAPDVPRANEHRSSVPRSSIADRPAAARRTIPAMVPSAPTQRVSPPARIKHQDDDRRDDGRRLGRRHSGGGQPGRHDPGDRSGPGRASDEGSGSATSIASAGAVATAPSRGDSGTPTPDLSVDKASATTGSSGRDGGSSSGQGDGSSSEGSSTVSGDTSGSGVSGGGSSAPATSGDSGTNDGSNGSSGPGSSDEPGSGMSGGSDGSGGSDSAGGSSTSGGSGSSVEGGSSGSNGSGGS